MAKTTEFPRAPQRYIELPDFSPPKYQKHSEYTTNLTRILKNLHPHREINILLAYASYTGGHRSVAESLREFFEEIPWVKVSVVNVLDHLGGKGSRNIQIAFHSFIIQRLRFLRSWAFRKAFEGNRFLYWLVNSLIKGGSWANRSFLNRIRQEGINLVVSSGANVNSLFSYWKKKRKIEFPVYSILTDFRAHQIWAQACLDGYYVASEQVKQDLVRFGVREEKIKITGIPIKRRFSSRLDLPKNQLRKKLGLDDDLPLILMMGGSLGLGPYEEVAASLNKLNPSVQVVFVTGTNEKMKARLLELKKQWKIPVKILAYIENLDEWIEASDIVITKPGGVSFSEVAARKKPIIRINTKSSLENIQSQQLERIYPNFFSIQLEELNRKVKDLLKVEAKKEALNGSGYISSIQRAADTIGIDILESFITRQREKQSVKRNI